MGLVELGGDLTSAFRIVVEENAEAEAAVSQDFDRQVDELQQQLGRTLTAAERGELYQQQPDRGDPDVAGAWRELYGQRFSDEHIQNKLEQFKANWSRHEYEFEHRKLEERQRLEQELKQKHNETGTYRPDELDQLMEQWEAAHHPEKVYAKLEQTLRQSGHGKYNLNDEESAKAYMEARLAEGRDETPAAVVKPALDTSSEEVRRDARRGAAGGHRPSVAAACVPAGGEAVAARAGCRADSG
jgi:hypothetical protein